MLFLGCFFSIQASPLLSPADQFPGLQSKMRVVLRVEVEAVKFLKEEPHRLDALLKRCKSITETLTTMRKYDITFCMSGNWTRVADAECEKNNFQTTFRPSTAVNLQNEDFCRTFHMLEKINTKAVLEGGVNC